MKSAKLIAIDGPIGVGKSSLSLRLAQKIEAHPQLDEPNPFLQRFYQDRQNHALQTQLFFLLSRYHQLYNLRQGDLFKQGVICDYLFEKDRIFARLNLDRHELALYERVHALLGERVKAPDLVIYLYADVETLQERLERKRLESDEDLPQIEEDYLREVVEAYNQFFFDYSGSPLLVVNTTYLDFERSDADLDQLIKKMNSISSGTNFWIPMMNTLT